eukprot:Gregarina_sp_Poly_1__10894@NODE_84_length_15393_cov_100_561529_g72_i0_p10_GENE_NODE_84_length_15393_cov_100_561529_g72_i0NODE_84_length_15393_cov_100_561529_g72_i0_p10_ORF_typecomplete_len158_score15_26_NODE_84_length_15393_cov_100_561529_g72_i01371514188
MRIRDWVACLVLGCATASNYNVRSLSCSVPGTYEVDLKQSRSGNPESSYRPISMQVTISVPSTEGLRMLFKTKEAQADCLVYILADYCEFRWFAAVSYTTCQYDFARTSVEEDWMRNFTTYLRTVEGYWKQLELVSQKLDSFYEKVHFKWDGRHQLE